MARYCVPFVVGLSSRMLLIALDTFFIIPAIHASPSSCPSSFPRELLAIKERKFAKKREHADTGTPTKPNENALSSNARFSQLGDLKHLDLIYKTALSLAVRSKPKSGVLTRGRASRVAKELRGLPAVHVRRVGRRLMGLLATGMLSNLAKRQVEDQSTRYIPERSNVHGLLGLISGFSRGRLRRFA